MFYRSYAPSMKRVVRIAAAVIVDGDGRSLLVRKRGTRLFMQPGGKLDPGEDPRSALRRELLEECELDGVHPVGPVALAETIAPVGAGSMRHIIHLIYEAALPDSIVHVTSHDPAIGNHRLVELAEIGDFDLRPPIGRFLSRWQPGDPFVPLGRLWSS